MSVLFPSALDMSDTKFGDCGKAHPTSECLNVTVQYQCPFCEKEGSREDKCVCPACDRQWACREEEFRSNCQQPPVCVPEIEEEPEDESCYKFYSNMRTKKEEEEDECPPCPEETKPKCHLDLECPGARRQCVINYPCTMCQLEEKIDKDIGEARANHIAEKRRIAEEKCQEEIRRLEEKRHCEEEKCLAEQKKQFMEQCIKEQQALIQKRREELEKCKELERQTVEECECDTEETKCEEEKPKEIDDKCGSSTEMKESTDCKPKEDGFAKCVAECATNELSQDDCSITIDKTEENKC